MRLRNIPRAESVLANSEMVIKDERHFRGKWNSEIFHNNHPLHIEVGMGKGQFILTLAEQNPDINYIGIERYSSVLLRAVEKLEVTSDSSSEETVTLHLPNLRFICMDATDLPEVFAENEVSRIYLNFSDPWPKARHARRRLTSPDFFARYDKVLVQDGQVEFKTDNRDLFDFSVESLGESETWGISECTYDLHHDEIMNVGNIMTEYEEKFSSMGNPICKMVISRGCHR